MSSLGSCLTRPFPFPFQCVGEVDNCKVYEFTSQAQLHVFIFLPRDRYSPEALLLLEQVLVCLKGVIRSAIMVILMHLYQTT